MGPSLRRLAVVERTGVGLGLCPLAAVLCFGRDVCVALHGRRVARRTPVGIRSEGGQRDCRHLWAGQQSGCGNLWTLGMALVVFGCAAAVLWL